MLLEMDCYHQTVGYSRYCTVLCSRQLWLVRIVAAEPRTFGVRARVESARVPESTRVLE